MSFLVCSAFKAGVSEKISDPDVRDLKVAFRELKEHAESKGEALAFSFVGPDPFSQKPSYSKDPEKGAFRSKMWIYFDEFKASTRETEIFAYNAKTKRSYQCQVVHGIRQYTDRDRARVIKKDGLCYFDKFYVGVPRNEDDKDEDGHEEEESSVSKSVSAPAPRKRARDDDEVGVEEVFDAMDKDEVAHLLSKNPAVMQLAVKKAILDLKEVKLAEVFTKGPKSEYMELLSKVMVHVYETGVKDAGIVFQEAVAKSVTKSDSFRKTVRAQLKVHDDRVKKAKQDRINKALENTTLPDIDDETLKGWAL